MRNVLSIFQCQRELIQVFPVNLTVFLCANFYNLILNNADYFARGTASLNANGFYFFVFSASIYFAHHSKRSNQTLPNIKLIPQSRLLQ